MNYYNLNRSRNKHFFHPSENSKSRGVVFPSLRDLLRRFQQGDDINSYMYETPFDGSIFKYEEFDEIYNRNKFLINALKKASLVDKERDEDDKRSAKDEKSDVKNNDALS